jgi:sialic acid synthase SpsE
MDNLHYDFLKLDGLLTAEQRHLRQQVRDYVTQEVLPTINDYWETAEFPREMALKLKDLPIMGGMLTGYGWTSSELENRQLARRSIHVARDLTAGHELSRDDLTVVRPALGIEPADLHLVVGRRLVRDLAAGSPLQWSDV